MFEDNILTESESITVHLGELGTQPIPSNTLGDLYHVSVQKQGKVFNRLKNSLARNWFGKGVCK
jgi:hypothetical protein